MASDISSEVVWDSLPALPQGWVWTHVNEISSLVRGVSYNKSEALKTSKDGFLPIIRATNINKQLNFDDLVYVPNSCISSEQMIRKFDVIFAMSSGSKDLVGKSAQANSDFYGGFGTFCGLIRPVKGLNEQYFGIFFQSPVYRKKISTLSSGIGINNLRRDDIESIDFPLPPLPEQHLIVTKIEELFTQLDAGVASLKKVQAQLKRYRQAVLKAAFEGRLSQEWREQHKGEIGGASVLLQSVIKLRKKLTKHEIEVSNPLDNTDFQKIPEEWFWCSSKDIFEFVTSGSRGWAKYYSIDGALFIRIGNLTRDSISLNFDNIQKVNPLETAEMKRTRVYENDILVSITADIGSIGLIPEGIGEAYINQHIALCRPIKQVNAKYIAWYLRSENGGNKQLISLQRGATKIGLGLDDIKSINIPLCPLIEQETIVSELERLFSIADEIEKTITISLRQAETLRQSILKRAFEGKLVPQNPDDEPTSILLERIKAEKAHHAAEAKKVKTLKPTLPKRKIKNAN